MLATMLSPRGIIPFYAKPLSVDSRKHADIANGAEVSIIRQSSACIERPGHGNAKMESARLGQEVWVAEQHATIKIDVSNLVLIKAA